MQIVDPYQSFKTGIKNDIGGAVTGILAGVGAITLIVFLLTLLWCVIDERSHLDSGTRIGLAIFLAIIIPCLFINRIANVIYTIWVTFWAFVFWGGLTCLMFYLAYFCFMKAFETPPPLDFILFI